MSNELTRETADDVVDRLREAVGDALQGVGVCWAADDVEVVYVRDDVRERLGETVLQDVGVDLLADRHLEVGNLRRHGLEGPTVSARLYDGALLVVSWVEGWPVAVATDPDPAHFGAVAAVLGDEITRAA